MTCIGSDSNRRGDRVRAGCNPVLLPMHLGRRSRVARARTIWQRIRPTLWNRTRTSRASAERADQLRKSGLRALRTFQTVRSADHHHRSSVVRERRARGAPRAFMRSRFQRAHLGRRCTRLLRGRTHHDSRSGLEIASRKLISCGLRFGSCPARNVERPPGFPVGGPSARSGACKHVNRVRDLRRYPYPPFPTGRRS